MPDPRARLTSVKRPETKYVAVGDSEVAYQVVGDGPNDVLWMYPWATGEGTQNTGRRRKTSPNGVKL